MLPQRVKIDAENGYKPPSIRERMRAFQAGSSDVTEKENTTESSTSNFAPKRVKREEVESMQMPSAEFVVKTLNPLPSVDHSLTQLDKSSKPFGGVSVFGAVLRPVQRVVPQSAPRAPDSPVADSSPARSTTAIAPPPQESLTPPRQTTVTHAPPRSPIFPPP